MHALLYSLILFVAIIIHKVVLFSLAATLGSSPDIVLIILVLYSLACSSPKAESFGFFAGIFLSFTRVQAAEIIGIYPFIYTLLCFSIARFIPHNDTKPSLLFIMLVTLLASLSKNILMLLILALIMRVNVPLNHIFTYLLEIIYTSLLVPLIALLMMPLFERWEWKNVF